MKKLALVTTLLAVALVLAPRAIAQTDPSPDQLIDNLTSINCPIPGVSDSGSFDVFLAEEGPMKPSATLLVEQRGQLSIPAVCKNAAARKIVQYGAASLPALIRHLDDNRSTQLVIGQDLSSGQVMFGGEYFADEYDARHETLPLVRCKSDPNCEKTVSFEKPYTVKVADICFVLIGQIVNRRLSAVRYQPTAIVMVNSPIEMPTLAERVRADWAGTDREGLKTSLLADLRITRLEYSAGNVWKDPRWEADVVEMIHRGALRRLRYYFPDTYTSLTGDDLEKRKDFESAERQGDEN